MRIRFCCSVVILAAGSGLIAGCHSPASPIPAAAVHSTPAEPRDRTPGREEKPVPNLAEAQAHYSTAVIAELDGNAEAALEEYYAAATNDPGDEQLVLDVTRRLVQARQPEKALDVLSRATARPDAPGTLYAQLGVIYSRLGKPELAVSANRTAIRRQPRALDGYRNLFVTFLQAGKQSDALNVVDEAARVTGVAPEFSIGLAELYANFGSQVPDQKSAAFASALAILQRIDNIDSLDPALRLTVADIFNVLGRNEQAARIYQDLIKRTADAPLLRESIRAKLADIYLRGRDRKQAAEQLEAMVRDNPTDAQAYYWLGTIASDAKDYSQAIDCFTKTLLLMPGFELVYYDLAEAQINADKGSDALETLERFRRRFPENSGKFPAEYLRAIAYSHQKDYTNAISHFTTAEINGEATDTNRLDELFYFQFGAACERNGDYAQAEKYFEKCLQLSPGFAEAQNYLGYMWAERGEKLERARDLIEKALKAEPKNAAYLDSMGWVLFKMNRPKEALDYLLKAIQLSEGEDATLYDHLGDIYAALGRGDQAREAWRKSLTLEPNEQVRKKVGPTAE